MSGAGPPLQQLQSLRLERPPPRPPSQSGGRNDVNKPPRAKCPYVCYNGDCQKITLIGEGDPIRCRTCGCRVLWKQRTANIVQHDCR